MLALPWQQQNSSYVKYHRQKKYITYFHLDSHILWLILFILFSSRYYTQGLNLSLPFAYQFNERIHQTLIPLNRAGGDGGYKRKGKEM